MQRASRYVVTPSMQAKTFVMYLSLPFSQPTISPLLF